MALDKVKNFVKVTVSTGYTSSDTSIVLNSGDGAKLPTAPFNLIWYNATDYPDVQSDPDKEIVRVTAISTDTLTITRGQEGTTAVDHNVAGKTYKMIQSITEKMIEDINNYMAGFASGFVAVPSTTQSIAASTDVKVAFDTEKFDGLGEYDTSLYRFTANAAGRYFFAVDLNFKFDSASDSHYCYLFLYKNGEATNQLTVDYLTDAENHTMHFTYNMELVAGDYIEIYVDASDTGSVVPYSRFSGQRVY